MTTADIVVERMAQRIEAAMDDIAKMLRSTLTRKEIRR